MTANVTPEAFKGRIFALGKKPPLLQPRYEKAKDMPYPATIKNDVVEDDVDVCVIGSGAAGAIIASELARAGKKVVLLEKGGYYYTEDMNQREIDMMSLLWKNAGASFTNDFGMAIAQGQCLGGSTVINDAVCFDTPHLVKQEWKQMGVTIDDTKWIDATKDIRRKIRVERVKKKDLNANNMMLKNACESKTPHYAAVLNERNCTECKKCGFCHLGCHYGTKNDMLSTYIHEALAHSTIKIYCNCSVDRITYGGSVADGVEGTFMDKDGNTPFKIRVNARVIVVSAGAIASSVLLLKSNIALDRAGKGLTFHPSSFIIGKFKEKINGSQGIPMAYSCTEFSVENGHEKGGFMIESIFPPLFQLALGIPPKYRDPDPVPSNYGNPDYHRSRLPHDMTYLAMAGVMVRDFKPRGSICLSKKGNAQVNFTLKGEEEGACRDRENLANGLGTLAEMWFDEGAKYVITGHNKMPVLHRKGEIAHFMDVVKSEPGGLQLASAHPQGGNRMGEGPECVVDSNCKVHGFDNLFVCDASVFPTAAGVNPQITVMTVAKLTADHIMERWADFPARTAHLLGKTCSASQPMFCSSDALNAIFHRSSNVLPVETLLNVEGGMPQNDPRRWNLDEETMTIYNNERWLGFFPEDEGRSLWKRIATANGLQYGVLRVAGRFWKRFYRNGGSIGGEVGPMFLPFAMLAKILDTLGLTLGFDAQEVEDPRNGPVIMLNYDFARIPGISKAYDLIKMVDRDTAIGKFEGEIDLPGFDESFQFYFALCRRYGVEFMTDNDHDRIYDRYGAPAADQARGRWRVRLVSDYLPDTFKKIGIDIHNLGRLQEDILFSDVIEELQTDSQRGTIDFSSWKASFRIVGKDLMVCRYSTSILPEQLDAESLGIEDVRGGTRRYYVRFMLQREGRGCK